MKKVFLIAVICIMGTLTYLILSTPADKTEKLMTVSATRYIQLKEYADELKRSLNENNAKCLK